MARAAHAHSAARVYAHLMSDNSGVGNPIFAEPDEGRLLRRLTSVTAGDLTGTEILDLAAGDLTLVKDLPRVSQQSVLALIKQDSSALGELEKMVGVSLDYVPVAYLDLARMAASAVGRIVDASRRAIGTGTMVSSRLLLTNNHVTPDVATGVGQIVQFDYELEVEGTPKVPSEFRLDPNTFYWTSIEDELDATLIAVGARISGARELREFGVCPLSGAADKHAEGDFVTLVQHPEGDYKQIALRENRVIGRGKGGTTLHYQSDTLPGSSGSPVFNDQFQLVALHHAGGRRNETTLENGSPVPDDSNEGMRVTEIVKTLRNALDPMADPARGILAEALDPPTTGPRFNVAGPESATPNPTTTTATQVTSVPVSGATTSAATGDFIVPIRITVQATGPATPTGVVLGSQPVPLAPAPGGLERNQPPDPQYARRRGYDPAFLDAEIPLPSLNPIQLADAAVPQGRQRTPDELRVDYRHFSVIINAARRMPFFTAVNIDGTRLQAVNRESGEVEATETWYQDPRITESDQLDQDVFERQQPRIFDRGHMVRRLDPAWGSAATARKASDDTFHFTNCCPQISAFNQRAALWAGIENYVLTNAKAEHQRITVFTGPVFRNDDPPYRTVTVPKAFWKILVRFDKGQLRVTAFLADQTDLLEQALGADRPERFDDLGNVATFQTTIANLAATTGLDFADLAEHDTAALEAAGRGARITVLDDVAW
jgi:endonuclease G